MPRHDGPYTKHSGSKHVRWTESSECHFSFKRTFSLLELAGRGFGRRSLRKHKKGDLSDSRVYIWENQSFFVWDSSLARMTRHVTFSAILCIATVWFRSVPHIRSHLVSPKLVALRVLQKTKGTGKPRKRVPGPFKTSIGPASVFSGLT